MRFLSLFAGIGGFDLGLERAGHECAGQVEIDGFCQRVLGERFNAPRWTDVREWQGDGDEQAPFPIDLLCGGFPCQDLSVAGKRAGLSGSRSGLFWEIVRIAKIVKAQWGLFENVPGLLSSGRGADMWTVLAGLRECWPAVGYRILDSRYFGVAQRRRRVFFVCGPSEKSVREVLFESEGGGGNSQESGEKAASLTRRAGEGPDSDCTDGTLVIDEQNAAGVPVVGALGTGLAHSNRGFSVMGTLREHVRPGSNTDLSVVHSLSAEGHDASEDGTGRGTPIVATLNSGGNDGGFRTEPGEHLVTAWNWQSGGDVRHSPGLPNLQANQTPAVGVRRLTPTECEVLQGFPQGFTCLCGASDEWRTALRVVYETAWTQVLPIGKVRELVSLAQEKILRLLVCSSAQSETRGLPTGFGKEAGTAIIQSFGLSPLRWNFGSESASQGREYLEQFAREFGIAVPILSYDAPLGIGHICEPGRCLVGEGPRSHYWEICRLDDEAAMLCKCPDSPRYRALGNAVTVNVIQWIGERLK